MASSVASCTDVRTIGVLTAAGITDSVLERQLVEAGGKPSGSPYRGRELKAIAIRRQEKVQTEIDVRELSGFVEEGVDQRLRVFFREKAGSILGQHAEARVFRTSVRVKRCPLQ